MQIPRIIHQTWKNDCIPAAFKTLMQTWVDKHPNWTFIFWTDDSSLEFVKTSYPEYLEIFKSYETNIQRVDFIRYLILYKIGGVYVDMDFECFSNLEPLLQSHSCVFSYEPLQHCVMHGVKNLICNAFMATIAEHPFIKLLIQEAIKPRHKIESLDAQVMHTTGPYMVTKVFNTNCETLTDVKILDSKYIYPLTRKEVLLMITLDEPPMHILTKLNEAYAVHYWLNTWVTNKKIL